MSLEASILLTDQAYVTNVHKLFIELAGTIHTLARSTLLQWAHTSKDAGESRPLMIRFGYFYLNGRLTIYDISTEIVHGRPVVVAALSEDPRICFSAVRAEHAVEQLKVYLAELASRPRPAVTWMPGTVITPTAS